MDRKNSNLHKQSASLGEHQLHHVLQKNGQSSNIIGKNNQYLNSNQQHLQSQADNDHNNHAFQNNQTSQVFDSNINSSSLPQNQKSQRINQQQLSQNSNPGSSTNSQQINLLKGTSNQGNYQGVSGLGASNNILQDYKNISKNFNSRQSIGNNATVNGIHVQSSGNTPISALTASFSQQVNGSQGQFNHNLGGINPIIGNSEKNSCLQQPQIISSNVMRQSIGPSSNINHIKYNKENVEMRSTSNGATNSNGQHFIQQLQSHSRSGAVGQQQSYGQQSIIKYLGGNSNNKHSQKNFSSSQATQNLNQQNNSQNSQSHQYGQQQSSQQQFNSHHSSINASNQFNKTTSFLKGAATGLTVNQLQQQIQNSNLNSQSQSISQQQQIFQQQYSSNQLLQPSSNSLNAEFGTDITNFTNSQHNILMGHQQQINNGQSNSNVIQTTGATIQSQYSQQSVKQQQNASNIQTTYSNRIPQPSIINSATGNMNQMIGRNTISGGSSGFQLQGSPRNLEPFSLGNHISNTGTSSSMMINNGIGNSVHLNNIDSAYHSQQQILNKINADNHINKKESSNLINQSISGSTSNQAQNQSVLNNPGQSNRATGQNGNSLSKMLQKPMIIDKYQNGSQSNNLNSVHQIIQKSNNNQVNNVTKNTSQIQSASRYLSREASSNNNVLNSSMLNSINMNGINNGTIKQFESINSSATAQALRKSTHQNNLSQISQNQQLNSTTNHSYMKRMRSSGNPNNHSVLAACTSTTNQNSTSQTATQRYQNHQVGQGKISSGGVTGIGASAIVQRGIRIDQRLATTLSNATNINQTVNYENGKLISGSQATQMPQNSSFLGVNKYNQHHLHAHEISKNTGIIQNFKETKSGQNLNGNLQTSVNNSKYQILSQQSQGQQNGPQTQRGVANQSNTASQSINGSNVIANNGKSSLKKSINCVNTASVISNTNQSSNNKGNSQQFGKQSVSGVTQKILKEHQEKQQDKENKQRLSNKPSISQGRIAGTTQQSTNDSQNNLVKRTKTSNADSRQSIVPNNQKKSTNQLLQNQSQNQGVSIQQQSNKKGQTTGSSQFKNSDQCEQGSSNGVNTSSNHQSSSHNHTNRSNGTAQGKSLQRLNSQANQILNNGQIIIDSSKPQNSINFGDQQMQQQTFQNSKSQNIQKKIVESEFQNSKSSGAQNIKMENHLTSSCQDEIEKTDDYQQLFKLQEVQCINNEQNVEMSVLPEKQKQDNEDDKKQDQANLQIKLQNFDQQKARTEVYDFSEETLDGIVKEMEERRKKWLKTYKTKLDLNDVLEIRNPQSVIEFVPEIMVNLQQEELKHLYPSNFLNANMQREISDKYRQYLVDWLAELHYKFKMWPETLFVTVGIIDKTLMKWPNFKKNELQSLGITALHIAGKYEEIYPPELKTILQVIDNAVTRQQVCTLESEILRKLDFDMVWPSVLRFMQRYACISNFNQEQHMIAQMFCDFILLSTTLLQHRPSLLGAVAIYATNKITNRSRPWNQSLVKCTLGIREEDVKNLANELFFFVKKLEQSSLKTMFRKYELPNYLNVVQVLQRIQMPAQQNQNEASQGGVNQQDSLQNQNNNAQQQQFQINQGVDTNNEQVAINE